MNNFHARNSPTIYDSRLGLANNYKSGRVGNEFQFNKEVRPYYYLRKSYNLYYLFLFAFAKLIKLHGRKTHTKNNNFDSFVGN